MLTQTLDIAFSTTYLRSNNAVAVHPSMGFHVVVVSAGTTHRVDASSTKIRLISIAAGKLRAKVSDEDFVVSTNGAIKVLTDVACVLQNPFSMDATVHISTQQQQQP